MRRWISICILSLTCFLVLAGCRRGDINIQSDGEGGLDVSITWTEAEVNTIVSETLAEVGNPLLRNPQVNFQDGHILVNGEHSQRDGNGTVSGSFILSAAVQNGAILLQVTDVQIEGVDLTDERIADLNARLSQQFNQRAERAQSRAFTVQSLVITDDDLTLSVHLQS